MPKRMGKIEQHSSIQHGSEAVVTSYRTYWGEVLTAEEIAGITAAVLADLGLDTDVDLDSRRDDVRVRQANEEIEQRVARAFPSLEREQGPDFDDVEAAIAWTLERAPVVYIRLGLDARYVMGRQDEKMRSDALPWPPDPDTFARLLADNQTFPRDWSSIR